MLTFGMMGVNLIKIFEFMTRGVPFSSAGAFLLYLMPMALSLTIPVSILVSVMLVFGRMSADNEITAMRACGISIFQIISPIIIITFILTCLCLYLQLEAAPYFSAKAKLIIRTVGLRTPLAILEPGRSIEYENYNIYIDDILEGNQLKDIQVYILSKDRSKVQQDITAARGRIELDEERETMKIALENATIKIKESQGEPPRSTFSKEISFEIDYGKNFNKISLSNKPRTMTLNELFGTTKFFLRNNRDTTQLEVELNQRIALGLSPIAFLL
ncbi:MAG: LptF/LptG family permease, partial [Candidatus Nanoarchaeia archaeon]